jgi:hypothetical protein
MLAMLLSFYVSQLQKLVVLGSLDIGNCSDRNVDQYHADAAGPGRMAGDGFEGLFFFVYLSLHIGRLFFWGILI